MHTPSELDHYARSLARSFTAVADTISDSYGMIMKLTESLQIRDFAQVNRCRADILRAACKLVPDISTDIVSITLDDVLSTSMLTVRRVS